MVIRRSINYTGALLAGLLVVACGWYVLRNHGASAVGASSAANDTAAVLPARSAVPGAASADPLKPTVTRIADSIQLSVDTQQYKQVQRVEFYIENNLVGAAYAAPYSVTIGQDSLAPGNHNVVAKVYTASAVTQTAPANFTSTASSNGYPITPASTSDDAAAAPSSNAAPTGQQLPAVSDLNATVSADGTAAELVWTGSSGAQYQVWRDGTQIAVTSTAGYEDTGLTAGQTYDYQVVAIVDGQSSASSNIAAVTIPSAQALQPQTNYLAPEAVDPNDTATTPAKA